MRFPINIYCINLSRFIGKPAFCICENKGADQLRDNRRATDQRLCFCYIDSSHIQIFTPLAIFCGCTARFVSDLVGNPEDRFSRDEAHSLTGIKLPPPKRGIIANVILQCAFKHSEDSPSYFLPVLIFHPQIGRKGHYKNIT